MAVPHRVDFWIDQTRRQREVPVETPDPGSAHAVEPRAPREAAGTLIGALSPQERAAVVLKDVFDLGLEEIAETLFSPDLLVDLGAELNLPVRVNGQRWWVLRGRP